MKIKGVVLNRKDYHLGKRALSHANVEVQFILYDLDIDLWNQFRNPKHFEIYGKIVRAGFCNPDPDQWINLRSYHYQTVIRSITDKKNSIDYYLSKWEEIADDDSDPFLHYEEWYLNGMVRIALENIAVYYYGKKCVHEALSKRIKERKERDALIHDQESICEWD